MANPEHLSILEQGVNAWNQWREEHQIIRPDLSGADLTKIRFDRDHIEGGKLSTSELSTANKLSEVEITKQ